MPRTRKSSSERRRLLISVLLVAPRNLSLSLLTARQRQHLLFPLVPTKGG